MVKLAKIKDFRLGNEIIQEPEVVLVESGKCILGLNILNKYQFTLDIKKEQLTLNKIEKDVVGSSGREEYYEVKVLLNEESVRFMVDTGAAISAISPTLQEKMNFPIVETIEVKDAVGNLSKLPVVLLETINIQGYQLSNVRAIISEGASDDGGVEGFLGTNVLKDFICDFDPVARQVTLTKHDEAE